MADRKVIAVVGATGAQGSGLVRAILADPQGGFAVRALTRDPNAPAAKALAAAGAEVVAADVDDAASLQQAAPQARQYLSACERGKILLIPIGEVIYLRAEQKYVTLRTAHRTLLLDESLAELEERLGRRFLRIHRNALVALDAVAALERRRWSDERGEAEASEVWAVRIAATDEWLAVSRRQLASVRDLLAAEGL